MRLLDQVVRATAPAPELTHLAVQTAKIMESVLELKQDLWDIDPDLAEERLRPQREADLSDTIAALNRGDQTALPFVIRKLLEYSPPRFESLQGDEQVGALREWWSEVEQPFVPVDYLDRMLDVPPPLATDPRRPCPGGARRGQRARTQRRDRRGPVARWRASRTDG